MLGKDLFLLPQTIGPFKGRVSRSLARFVMRRAKAVYSRDMEGMLEARRLLGLPSDASKVRFCYDLGFLCEPHLPVWEDLGTKGQVLPTDRPLVGLNVSGLLLMGGYGRDNTFGLKVDYHRLIERIIRFLIDIRNANVLLVPHVFGTQAESDTAAVGTIYRELNIVYPDRLFCVRGDYNQNEIKHIIGRCDLFIGSRMHACIAALSQSIPAVAIAYSRKFVGVLQTIGAERLVVDPRHVGIEEILGIIGQALSDRHEIQAHLLTTMPVVKNAVLALASELR
jgi:polysaccharide pyruvyl transferase WcaK-like protein